MLSASESRSDEAASFIWFRLWSEVAPSSLTSCRLLYVVWLFLPARLPSFFSGMNSSSFCSPTSDLGVLLPCRSSFSTLTPLDFCCSGGSAPVPVDTNFFMPFGISTSSFLSPGELRLKAVPPAGPEFGYMIGAWTFSFGLRSSLASLPTGSPFSRSF